jgi:hypothetical protein
MLATNQISEPPPTIAELVEIRRDNLLSARALPHGPERNQMRQIARCER